MTPPEIACVGDLVHVIGGGTPKRDEPSYYGGDIPWITPKDMKFWELKGAQVSLTQAGVDNSTTKIVPVDSVLVVVRSGVLKHTVPVGINRVPVAINQDMKALIPSSRVDADYLARFIKARSIEVLSWVRATTADNFPIENLKNLEIVLPLLTEQRRIVAVLDQVDTLRAQRRKAIALLDDLAQSVFLDMFSKGDIPVRGRLGDCLTFITSGGRGWAKYYSESGSRFIRSLDVRMNEIWSDGAAFIQAPNGAEARRTRIEPGDVLLTITGSRIGRVAPVSSSLEGAYVSQHVAILRPDRAKIKAEYLSWFLSLPSEGQRQIEKMQYGQSKPGLNFRQISDFSIPVPEVSAQEKFVERVRSVGALQNVHRTHLIALDELFECLQQRAFAGQLWDHEVS